MITPNNAVNPKILEGIQNPKLYNFSFRCSNRLTTIVPRHPRINHLTITTDSFEERPMVICRLSGNKPFTDPKFNCATYQLENVKTMYIKINYVQHPNILITSKQGENDNGFWCESMLHLRATYLQFSGLYTNNTFLNPANFQKYV